MKTENTIVAIATPPGKGGIGIVRISGSQARKIAEEMILQTLQPRMALYTSFLDENKNEIDKGIALFFNAPHSFTGEDVLELQAHGGPIVLDLLVARAIQLGAELAAPGEFSLRAFLNNKIDLVQAEAIADLISASSRQSALAAQKGMQGSFSEKIIAISEEIQKLRIYVEAAIDFPEEEIDFLSEPHIANTLKALQEKIKKLLLQATQGSILREGWVVVIAGKPNAGKSSLLNCLSQRNVAIVTDIPGTTRDILRETIHLDGIPLHIVDTAGLRETKDKIEQEGIRRAQDEIARADKIFWLVDATEKTSPTEEEIIALLGKEIDKSKILILYNKIDLLENDFLIEKTEYPSIKISAKTNMGISEISDYLKKYAGWEKSNEHVFTARRRHLALLENAKMHLDQGWTQLEVRAGELLAEELRCAHNLLGEITGKVTSDALLGEIFSTFCIGK